LEHLEKQIRKYAMEFHHVGIPTQQKRDNETYLEGAKVYITDMDATPYKIEWLRFEQDSPMPDAIQDTAHVAFKVDDLDAALEGKDVILDPTSPMEGLTIAFILEDGAPVELMKFES
jgi:hypothetical protein